MGKNFLFHAVNVTIADRPSHMKYCEILKIIEAKCLELGEKPYRSLLQSREFSSDLKRSKVSESELQFDSAFPVDLISVRKNSSGRRIEYNYSLFWVFSNPTEVAQMENKIRFYHYYLSRIVKLTEVETIIVVTSDQDITNSATFCKYNGFGLWVVDSESIIINIEPLSLRSRMIKFLEAPFEFDPELKKFGSEVINQSKDLALFFDLFVSDAIMAMTGERSGKKIFSRQLLDKVFDLKNISYKDRLSDIVADHLKRKEDDYNLVDSVFSQLWKEIISSKLDYSGLLKTCEPPLFYLFPNYFGRKPYRDHYLHQFQVFLIGLLIIDGFHDQFDPENTHLIEKQWLVCASFHDMAYPIQLFDSWAQSFFKDTIGIPDFGVTDISKAFINNSLLSSTADIVNRLYFEHKGEELKGNWIRNKKDLIALFYDNITKSKHHSIISSIYLLKYVENKDLGDLVDTVFIPSALAISIHHDIIWKDLRDRFDFTHLEFENDKLSFLLLLCDALQEWCRPGSEQFILKSTEESNFNLEKLEFGHTSKICTISLQTNIYSIEDDDFQKKISELQDLKGFLKAPKNHKIKVILKDKNGDTNTCTISS